MSLLQLSSPQSQKFCASFIISSVLLQTLVFFFGICCYAMVHDEFVTQKVEKCSLHHWVNCSSFIAHHLWDEKENDE